MKINPNQFDSIIKKGYSLDHVYLLELIRDEIDIKELLENSVKISTLYQTLIRKNLIISNKLTLEGKHLLEFIESDDTIKFTKLKVEVSNFDSWWNTYKSTDTILLSDKTRNMEDKKVLFEGSRGFKVKKDECKEKFNKILLEGEHLAEDLIRALKYEIDLKVRKSIKSGQNNLSFFQNSLTYINQRTYENFIEISKTIVENESEEPKETKSLF